MGALFKALERTGYMQPVAEAIGNYVYEQNKQKNLKKLEELSSKFQTELEGVNKPVDYQTVENFQTEQKKYLPYLGDNKQAPELMKDVPIYNLPPDLQQGRLAALTNGFKGVAPVAPQLNPDNIPSYNETVQDQRIVNKNGVLPYGQQTQSRKGLLSKALMELNAMDLPKDMKEEAQRNIMSQYSLSEPYKPELITSKEGDIILERDENNGLKKVFENPKDYKMEDKVSYSYDTNEDGSPKLVPVGKGVKAFVKRRYVNGKPTDQFEYDTFTEKSDTHITNNFGKDDPDVSDVFGKAELYSNYIKNADNYKAKVTGDDGTEREVYVIPGGGDGEYADVESFKSAMRTKMSEPLEQGLAKLGLQPLKDVIWGGLKGRKSEQWDKGVQTGIKVYEQEIGRNLKPSEKRMIELYFNAHKL